MKINVLDVSFGYNGTLQTIKPVIIQDNETMILVDTGYDNITSNVPPISLTNVPGVSLLNVPPVSLTNVPEK